MKIFCDCGPGRSLREVKADRTTRPFKVQYFGQRALRERVNRCRSCGKCWLAPRVSKRGSS